MSDTESQQLPTFAALQDIAHLRQDVLDALPFGIVVYEAVTPTAFRFIAANAFVFTVSHFTVSDYGRLLTDLFPPADAERQSG